ncbi:MAG TPA: radical SAM protein [Terriglobia bacterium]|nr:radical SAM protein [Terriglobia bacterium]
MVSGQVTVMFISKKALKRGVRSSYRRLRELRMIAKGLLSTKHPVLAHIVPMRRCNLSCTYCNEFDKVSTPVPTEEMFRRIDRLASFGTTIVTISGGEPLLHPDLDRLIQRIRRRGMLAGLITNAYLLGPDRVERLNRAGLDHMQISIDNVIPDDVSKKSLKVLDRKLRHLAAHAEFGVNINSVLGAGTRNPEDALTISKRAAELGFTSTVGIIHDGGGQLRPLADNEQAIFRQIMARGRRSYSRFKQFQENIARGRPNDWRCRAGARYLYVCENGLVHYCSQQRGYPAVSLYEYTREDMEREFHTRKLCAPFCTVSCVQQVAMLDNRRAPQTRQERVPLTAPEFER